MKASPILNILAGTGAIAEALLVHIPQGNSEGVYDCAIAAGTNFVSGVIPYIIGGRGTSIASGAANVIQGITPYLLAKPSRSVSYNLLPRIGLAGLGLNILEDISDSRYKINEREMDIPQKILLKTKNSELKQITKKQALSPLIQD
jgi:hypothetical protein